ncbi:MAG: hypothetical protein WC476_03075 [Phycisphaerae bacterium]
MSNYSDPDVSSGKVKTEPIVIWHFRPNDDSLESLELALSTGLINHVSIGAFHRKDAGVWRKKGKNPDYRKSIEIARKYNVKVIWKRPLWPFWVNEGISYNTFFDVEYYVNELKILREEAKELGADFVAIDVEGYGDSPLEPYLKEPSKWLNKHELERLRETIRKVVEKAGKADFVWPVGWFNFDHTYVALAGLGENRVSECTYYDNASRLRKLKQNYEIFGAYLNTTKENKGNPKLPYFLPSEIFERSELWSHEKGVFLYPKESNSLAVAKALADYAKTLPHKDGNSQENNKQQDDKK